MDSCETISGNFLLFSQSQISYDVEIEKSRYFLWLLKGRSNSNVHDKNKSESSFLETEICSNQIS